MVNDHVTTADMHAAPSDEPLRKRTKTDLSASFIDSSSHETNHGLADPYMRLDSDVHSKQLFAHRCEEDNKISKHNYASSASSTFDMALELSNPGYPPSATEPTPMLLYPYEDGEGEYEQMDMDDFSPNPASQTGNDGLNFGGSIHRSIPSDSLPVNAYSELAHALGPVNRPRSMHISASSTSSD